MHLLNSYLNFVRYNIEPNNPDKNKTNADRLRFPSIFSETIYPVTLFIEIITETTRQVRMNKMSKILAGVKFLCFI